MDEYANIQAITGKYAEKDDFFYIGQGYLYPTDLEGALKLEEISYIHAEGYHAVELKHGLIALLDEETPVVVLLNNTPEKRKRLEMRKNELSSARRARHGDRTDGSLRFLSILRTEA